MTPEDLFGIVHWTRWATRQMRKENDLSGGMLTVGYAVNALARVRSPYQVVWRAADLYVPATNFIPDVLVCMGLNRKRASEFGRAAIGDRSVWFCAELVPRRKVPAPLRRFVLERAATGLEWAEALGIPEGRAAVADYDYSNPELSAVPEIWSNR